MAINNFAFGARVATKVTDFVGTKAKPTVYTQNPPAGTPLTEGMFVEVRVASLSDVPLRVILPGILPVVADVPIQVLSDIFEADPELKALAAAPALADDQTTILADKVNAGLTGKGFGAAITPANAAVLIKDLLEAGFFPRVGGR